MATYYWVGGTGTWSGTGNTQFAITSGGAPTLLDPNVTDTVIFDTNSGTAATVTVAATAVATATTVNKSDINLFFSGNATLTSTTGFFTLTAGTITLNSYILTVGTFSSSNANARTIAFGTGNINVTGNNGFIWFASNVTNLTVTGTPTVNLTYSGGTGTRTISAGQSAGGNEARSFDYNILAGTDTISFTGGGNVRSVNFSGFSGTWNNTILFIYGSLTLSSGMTVNAGTNTIYFNSASATQNITTSGKTLDFPINLGYLGTEANTLVLQDNLTMGATRLFALFSGTLNLTGNSGNWTLTIGFFGSSYSTVRSIAFGTGNITVIGSGLVWNTGTVTNFSRTGTPTVNISNNSATATTVTTGAMSAAQALDFNYTVGTYTLTDTAAVYKSVNFTGFAGTIPNSVRTIHGSLTVSTGMTLTAGANVTTFASTTVGNTITSNGKTLDFPLTFNGVGGVWACQDALTQGSTRAFTITNGTVQLKDSVTSTVGSFVATSSSVKFLQSTTLGSQATLSQAAGTVNVVDLTIRDINAVGEASWNAYTDFENTDAGNNDGWNFSLSPPYSTAELPITLRPFTQPRRF
jgi:hypothetical protein